MSEADIQKMIQLLTEIRDNQKIQLERQTEGLAFQREHFSLVQKQYGRVEQIQDRAEQIQAKSAQLVAASRKVIFWVALPILVLLLGYTVWMIVR